MTGSFPSRGVVCSWSNTQIIITATVSMMGSTTTATGIPHRTWIMSTIHGTNTTRIIEPQFMKQRTPLPTEGEGAAQLAGGRPIGALAAKRADALLEQGDTEEAVACG